MSTVSAADTIIHSGRIATLDRGRPLVSAVAVRAGRVLAVGDLEDLSEHRDDSTKLIDADGRTVVPGLNDSHLHIVRGGLNYNMELRWDDVPSLSDAMGMLARQAERTPPPQWVRVIGGWSEFQFAERRMPTLDEVNAAAPDTPVFILHLYTHALLNRAAVRALGYTRDTPDPAGGEIQRGPGGEPTGLLIAAPNAAILYGAIAAAPVLGHDAQLNSTRQFMRELNRLGITSAIDAGGGSQRYPEDYDVISELAGSRDMTVRIAYNLFTQKPGQELDDFRAWTKLTAFGDGDARLRVNGVGEMIVYSSYDFENFMQPRPDIPADGRRELSEAIEYLVQHRWPFRLHATYDESIAQYLDVFEAVDRQTPFAGLHWFFDHAETISERSIERVAALGGGIAVQDRMAFAGEHLVSRYGQAAADATPPIKSILAAGIPVGAGTDATRVASYNPWVSLYWMVTGKTVGGHELWSPQTCLDRTQALRLYTQGSAWFSREQEAKGALVPGQYADLAILSADYFSVEVEEIKEIESVLTIMDGEVVYAVGRYAQLAPPALPVVPDWCPVGEYGGAHRPAPAPARTDHTRAGHPPRTAALRPSGSIWGSVPGLACPCFAF